MAKVFVINGVRCVPERKKYNAATIVSNAKKGANERAELARTILDIKANEILRSL